MPNPKHRHSPTRRDKRRTHDKAEAPTISRCSNCGSPTLYHRICSECGHYKGKLVIEKNVTA